MTNEELKRCPFCGSESVMLGEYDGMYQGVCSKCHGTVDEFFDSAEEAFDAWNTRPIEDELREKIRKLEAENKRFREALEHVVTTDTTVDKYGIWRIDGKTFQTWADDVLKGNEE